MTPFPQINTTPTIHTTKTDHVVGFRFHHNHAPLQFITGKDKAGFPEIVFDTPNLFAQAGYDTSTWVTEGTYQLPYIAEVVYERQGDTRRQRIISVTKTDVAVKPLRKVLVGYLCDAPEPAWIAYPVGSGECYTQTRQGLHPSVFHFNARSPLNFRGFASRLEQIQQEALLVLPSEYRYQFELLREE